MNSLETFNRVVNVNVDVQNDFCPGGTLATADGDLIVPNLNRINRWVRQNKGIVAFTQDWHPAVTSHFSDSPDYKKTWPVHCVANTWGAKLRAGLEVVDGDEIMHKATGADEDGYSGFLAKAHDGMTLEGLVRPVAHERVAMLLSGIALDVCVKATGLDGIDLEHRLRPPERTLGIFLVRDAVSSVTPEGGEEALQQLEAAGVSIITTQQLLNGEVIQVRN